MVEELSEETAGSFYFIIWTPPHNVGQVQQNHKVGPPLAEKATNPLCLLSGGKGGNPERRGAVSRVANFQANKLRGATTWGQVLIMI